MEAEADSVYIFKVWPKMGILVAQAGIERMDLVQGAAAVRGARMVVTTWPGTPMIDDRVRADGPGAQGVP